MLLLKKLYLHFEEYMAVIACAIMVLALTSQVLMRLFTGESFAWSEEMSRYGFLWAVYLGAAFAAKKAIHVRITAQFLKAGYKTRLFFRIIADALWVAGCLYIACQSWNNIEDGMLFPEISPTMHIAKVWIEIIIPISFVMVAWRIVEDWIVRCRNHTINELLKYEEDA
jgi:TRAP-type C4-dicarboxylate transport system permease small subunit